MKSASLWGDFKNLEPVRTPTVILREQAEVLGGLSNYVLYGQVTQRAIRDQFLIELYIIVPGLDDYQFQILGAKHTIDIYPLDIYDHVNERSYSCPNEDHFIATLRDILSSEKVRRAIEVLISQVRT